MHPEYFLPLVRLDKVSLHFGQKTVFNALSLELAPGRHIALLGPNGAGKSSLLRLIQGDLRPSADADPEGMPSNSGKVFWAFEGLEESSALSARDHVRLVSHRQQSRYARQGWNITGEEVLLSGIDNAPMVYGEVAAQHYEAAAELARAAHASAILEMLVPSMSQGQLRLTLILRALMSRPALLLLDEPYDGLDSRAREDVNRSIALAAQRGSTIVVSAHRSRDIPAFIHDALVLDQGVPRACKLSDLRDEQIREPSPCPPSSHTGDQWLRPGKRAENRFVRALLEGTSPRFQLQDVDVFINRQKVLSDLSWTVQPGEQWIVSGSNGAGKSTLLRLLYGEEFAAFGGSLTWCGGMRPSLEELRTGVGYVSDRLQDTYDYDLQAEEVVISGLRGNIGLYHEPLPEERALALNWLERLGVAGYADQRFYDLSSGTARKVLLARALAGSPPVLLLDEPCSGLDRASRKLFLDALPLLAEIGVTIVCVSHHEQDRISLFTHELRLEKGKVAFCGKRLS